MRLQVDYFEVVVLLDIGVGAVDGAAFVGHEVGGLFLAEDLALDATEPELSLLSVSADGDEVALHVVKEAEFLRGLGQGDGVHVAEGALPVPAVKARPSPSFTQLND